MPYDYDLQLSLGLFGEQRLQAFRHENYTLTKASHAQEQQGGYDFIFVDRKTGEAWTLELKTDFRAYFSRNAFIETVSVDDTVRQLYIDGWAYTSEAQILLYFIPQTGQIFVIKMQKLRKLMPAFVECFPTVSTFTRAKGRFYRTHGILVPLAELARLATDMLELPIKLPQGYNSSLFDGSDRAKKNIKKKPLTALSPNR